MGRYYTGDIEGKFWFAVQDSTDASFFGGIEEEPRFVDYSFDEKDLPTIKEGLKKCVEALGGNKKKLDKFFKENDDYSNEDIKKVTGIKDEHGTASILEWYARLELGEKIYKCVKEQGTCRFEAEL